MNKKGFTLVELLAVLLVLVLISLIAVPAVTKIINSTKDDLSDSQMKNIERVLDNYIAANADTLADGDEVCIIDLKKEGLLTNKDIINSKTGEKYDGCFYLSWNNQKNQFDYFYGNDSVVVTFDANGGTVDTNSKTVYVGSKYGSLPTPVREGYTFKGWNGKNLFDKNRIDNSHFLINKTGFISSETGSNMLDDWASSNIISVKPNTYYIKSGNIDAKTQDCFDINMNFIQVNNIVSGTSFLTPSNCYYIKFNLKRINSPYNNVQLEEGSEATPYEPYYITKDTTVVQTGNHTLTAIWEAN